MKKLIVAAFLVVGFTTFAQVEKRENAKKEPIERMSPAERSQMALKKMTKNLNLNEAQQKQMGALLSEAEANKETNNKAAKSDRQLMKDKISKILTPEQNAKWDKIQAERKGKIQGKIQERKEQIKERREEKVEKSEDK
jgi:Spy/CpxP family protein refolding chaperone